jgi:hypothetical protein
VYPREVTEQTELAINDKLRRSTDAYVKTILQLPIDDPRYIRDQYGTKCNFFVRDVLRLMGVILPPLTADSMIRDFQAGKYGFQKMLIQDALTNAWLGSPTVAGLPELPHGHVVMVLPTPATIDRKQVMVAQAGATNFFGKPMTYSWPVHQLQFVEFFGAP